MTARGGEIENVFKYQPVSRQQLTLTFWLLLFISIDATISPATSNRMVAMAGPERHKVVCISVASKAWLILLMVSTSTGLMILTSSQELVKRGETKNVRFVVGRCHVRSCWLLLRRSLAGVLHWHARDIFRHYELACKHK